jgi:hypothetical protein
MFGSNFFGNFGIPEQPQPQAGVLGGQFGAAPDGSAQQGAQMPGQPLPAAGLAQASAQPPPGATSPLGGGPLAPGGGLDQPGTAPAAGVGSPFGKTS